jgi:ABC-type glycerol-3-phosphate transport system substrate-binding protein
MKRIIMLSTLAAAMALMLALAGSASAAEPETETFHAEGTDVLAKSLLREEQR